MSILIAWELGANFGHLAPRQYWRSSSAGVSASWHFVPSRQIMCKEFHTRLERIYKTRSNNRNCAGRQIVFKS